MSLIKMLLLTLGTAILVMSCKRHEVGDFSAVAVAAPTNVVATSKDTFNSVKELREFLVPGLATNLIANRLGTPGWIEQWGDATRPRLTWWYDLPPMPAEGAIVGTFVVGFTVDITNGQLAYLGFIYSRTEPPPPVGTEMLLNSDWREGNTNGPRSSVLRLFLVNSNLAVGSHLIGTKELQKLGYIAPNPLIEINRLKDLRLDEAMITNEEHNAYRQWTFYITFSPVDAPRVEAAIGDKVLSLMVITVDDDVIMPVIFNEPIGPNGLVRLDVTNFEMMESAKQKFSKLERTVGNQ